jgi:hypothetical protein
MHCHPGYRGGINSRLPNSLGGLEDSRYLPSSAPRRYTNSTTLGAALQHASYGGRHVCVERFTG